MDYTVTVTRTHTISPRRIADLMVTAVEGGIAYWCQGFLPDHIVPGPYLEDGIKGPWYNDERVWDDPDLRVKVVEDEPSCEQYCWWLTPATIQRGLSIMADRYPEQFGLVLEEGYDAGTADLFVQLCVFGEEVYG